ncbi:MAG: hypothetical protein V1722_01205 [Candidatus Micrarchaeota archaeon]
MKNSILLFGLLFVCGLVFAASLPSTLKELDKSATSSDKAALERLRIPEFVEQFNANTELIPSFVKVIIGTEFINAYIDNEIVGFATSDAKIAGYKYGELQGGSTLNVYISKQDFNAILDGRLTYETALRSRKLRYEAVRLDTKVKTMVLEVADFLLSIFKIKPDLKLAASNKNKTNNSNWLENERERTPVDYNCTDSDGGEYKTHAGTVTLTPNGRVETESDFCINETFVKEYYCAPRNSGAGMFYKDLACGEDYKCANGECQYLSYLTCTDTDNGVDAVNVGNLTLTQTSGTRTTIIRNYTDACSGTNAISENYCTQRDDGRADFAFSNVRCPFGYQCANGGCTPFETQYRCYDSDAGLELHTFGTVNIVASNGSIMNLRDECQTGYSRPTIREYYCNEQEPGRVTYRNDPCYSGETCTDGKCVVPTLLGSCTDPDATNFFDKYIRTTTTNSSGASGTDYCEADVPIEYACRGNNVTAIRSSCSSAEACINGVCVRPPNGFAWAHCVDSDQGVNEFRLGTVTMTYSNQTQKEFQDTCLNENTALDYVCDAISQREPHAVKVACDPGKKCRIGVCN